MLRDHQQPSDIALLSNTITAPISLSHSIFKIEMVDLKKIKNALSLLIPAQEITIDRGKDEKGEWGEKKGDSGDGNLKKSWRVNRMAGHGEKGTKERRRVERELVQNGCNYFPAIRYHLIKYLQQNYIYMMNGTFWMKVRNGPSADINR